MIVNFTEPAELIFFVAIETCAARMCNDKIIPEQTSFARHRDCDAVKFIVASVASCEWNQFLARAILPCAEENLFDLLVSANSNSEHDFRFSFRAAPTVER